MNTTQKLPSVTIEKESADGAQLTTKLDTSLQYKFNEDGTIRVSKANMMMALSRPSECGLCIRYDDFSGDIIVSKPNSDEWILLDDNTPFDIALTLESPAIGFADIPTSKLSQAIGSFANRNRMDTLLDWINTLIWDGVPRVEMFLSSYLSCEDTPYSRAVSRYMWTGLAGRAFEGGIKLDMALILVGSQGTGKSQVVKSIAPKPSYYAEIPLNIKDEDLSRLMREKVIGELPELSGMRDRDIQSMKAFVSRTHECWIPKYREYETSYARRLLFIGTTNEDEILNDPTGERRWLPINVGKCNPAKVVVDRDQLWAEGAFLFLKTGIDWHEAQTLAPVQHEKFRDTDSWEDPIREWLKHGHRRITMADALEYGVKITTDRQTKSHQNRMGKVLVSLGCTKRSECNRRGWDVPSKLIQLDGDNTELIGVPF